MTKEDRELLVELTRLNSDMASLVMRIMEGSAGTAEQAHYAQRLIAAGERLRRRADEEVATVIAGEVLAMDEGWRRLLEDTTTGGFIGR